MSNPCYCKHCRKVGLPCWRADTLEWVHNFEGQEHLAERQPKGRKLSLWELEPFRRIVCFDRNNGIERFLLRYGRTA